MIKTDRNAHFVTPLYISLFYNKNTIDKVYSFLFVNESGG